MADGLLALLKNIRSTRRNLTAGEFVFRAGDPAQAMFHVEQGSIHLKRDGVPLSIAETGQAFAEGALFTDCHDCDALATAPSRVVTFPKTAVLLLLKAHPDLNLAFSAYLVRQMERLRLQKEILRLKGADERVLAWLAHGGARHEVMTPKQPLTVVARSLGLTREALYRTLGRLEKDGVLERVGTRSFRLHMNKTKAF